jgi:molybdopterin converting factor small subunit
MHVKVKLFASLAAMVPGSKPGSPVDVELPPGSNVSDLVSRLHLPKAAPRVIFVNGRAENMDRVLRETDEVGMFPPIGGG